MSTNKVTEEAMITLSVNEIKVDDAMNLRQEGWEFDDSLVTLAEDITKRGQLQPVLVTPVIGAANGDPRYSLVAGFRRFRAIRMANEEGGKNLPVLARVVNVDVHGAMLDNLAENVQRQNLSPMDSAFAAKRLAAEGMSTKEIAKQFGKTDSWLRQIKSLLTLPENLQRDVHAGKLDFGIARKLVGLDEKQQAHVLDAVRKAVDAGEATQKAADRARGEVADKQSGGRKAKDETKAAKKGLSAKAAVTILGEMIQEVKTKSETERVTKAETKTAESYDLMVKFLHGKFGATAFHKKMVELLGA